MYEKPESIGKKAYKTLKALIPYFGDAEFWNVESKKIYEPLGAIRACGLLAIVLGAMAEPNIRSIVEAGGAIAYVPLTAFYVLDAIFSEKIEKVENK